MLLPQIIETAVIIRLNIFYFYVHELSQGTMISKFCQRSFDFFDIRFKYYHFSIFIPAIDVYIPFFIMEPSMFI
jgi:hypothetical protein